MGGWIPTPAASLYAASGKMPEVGSWSRATEVSHPLVHVHVPAEGGAEVGVVVEGWGEGFVEAVADGVVAVEEVDELAA